MKRFNNKILLLVLAVLVAAFVFTRLFRSPARESNLDVSTLSIDTARIDEVRISPATGDRKEINLHKDGTGWKVSHDQVTSPADKDRVKRLLERLAGMRPERIVTRKQEKWNDYLVGDTTGTTVIALSNSDEVARLHVGKDQMNVTYVRKDDKDEVYAVTGAIGSSFNLKFNDWRDRTFLRTKTDEIKKITFTYPADSGFVLSKNENTWMVDHTPADSAKTVSYLNKLRSKELSNFADNFSPDTPPDVTVVIDAKTPITIKGWRSSNPDWIVTSDLQPGVYFSDQENVIARDILRGRSQFTK